MSTLTINMSVIRTCQRCGVHYDWRRVSHKVLAMTYCGSLCEKGALGFTIEALEHMTPTRTIQASALIREVAGVN